MRKCKQYKSGAERHIVPQDIPDKSVGFGSAKVTIKGRTFKTCKCGRYRK